MIVEAKFTTAGMSKGKRYDVIEERNVWMRIKLFYMMEP